MLQSGRNDKFLPVELLVLEYCAEYIHRFSSKNTVFTVTIAGAEGITFHVANKCPFPVWPATAPNTGHPVLADGGFFLPPGQSKSVRAPATWNGRFWGRTGCNFTSANGNADSRGATAACLTGDCEGRLSCNGSIGTPPATLVEVNGKDQFHARLIPLAAVTRS